jgi:hypothetical protein
MNRKQQPKQEQYCEDDWNNVSTIDSEAYWVSKVRSTPCKTASVQCQQHGVSPVLFQGFQVARGLVLLRKIMP